MKYIIDVTQLVHWPGRLTGIPRVIEELAKRFSAPEREVVYVSWVKELGVFCVINFEATLGMRGSGIEYLLEGDEQNPASSSPDEVVETAIEPSRLSTVQRTKVLAKKIIRKLKIDGIPVVQRLRHRRFVTLMQYYQKVAVNKDDVIFIGAGEWWDDAFISYIEQMKGRQVKIVQISHDLLPMTAPQFSGHATESLSTYNRRIFPISSLILSVSEATKKDITSWMKKEKLPIPPIEVFRLGEDFTKQTPLKPETKDFIKSGLKGHDYLLSVGTIEARKNHAILYYTYKLAKARGIELPKLLMVGRKGWKTENIYDFITEDPDTKDMLIPLHDVSDAELSWLYDNCLFTIFPSQCEGWGMPIAESITRGVPVISGDVSSMAEVAPGYTVNFSPNSTDELLNAIMSMLDPKTREKQKGIIKSYKPTTWDDSFKQVIKHMERL